MPRNKDLKRLVRTRMRKTGEAYTTARAQLLKKAPAPKIDYAKIAGMSDTAIKAKTGCTWESWTRSLDRHGADKLSHTELAEIIHTTFKVGDWWAQTVAVGYERIKGLRTRGQRRDGSFSANKSRTFSVSAEKLFDAWHDAAIRKRWFGDGSRVRTSQRAKSMRLGLSDGGIVAVNFIPKGKDKSAVAVQQEKLPSTDAAAQFKVEWSNRFDALASILSA
jgi:hypothetical protein